jgi:phage anti-repressor protein
MPSLDIVNLIEKNPISKLSGAYNSKFLAKIKEEFTESQQQLFIASFYCYINHNKNTDFVINLDNIWEWLGFSQKKKSKNLLVRNFILDIDYKCSFARSGEQKEGRGGNNKETILLNIKTFKLFCIMAETNKAREIHEYFVKLEELLHDMVQEESDELKLQIQTQNEKVQILETKLIETQNEQEFNKIALSVTPYIYIYNLDTTIVAPAIPKLKIGYSMCLKNRTKPFNTICPHGKLVFSQEVKYLTDVADLVLKEKELRKLETCIHNKLSPFHDGKENFKMEIEDAKLCVINEYNNFKLYKNTNCLDRQLKMKKIYEFSNSIINDEPENKISMCDSSTQTEYNELEPILSEPIIHGDQQLLKKFNEFVETHCIVRDDVEVSAKDIQGAYKIYSREAKKETTQAFTDFLSKKFVYGRMQIQNANQIINGYSGLKLKEMEYKKQNIVINDEETCIFANFVFSPSKTVLFSSIIEEYKSWKINMGKTFDAINDVKKMKKYLKSCPYVLFETVWSQQGSGQGYYGIGLLSEVAYHRKSSTGCEVEQCDLQDNVLKKYDTIAKAAAVEKLCAAKMSRHIRDKIVINSSSGAYYFRKKNV